MTCTQVLLKRETLEEPNRNFGDAIFSQWKKNIIESFKGRVNQMVERISNLKDKNF